MTALAERKKQSSTVLVFPGDTGKPDGHLLLTFQKLAFRAGLN